MVSKKNLSEWSHSFQVYQEAEKLCHFLFRNMCGSVFIPETIMLVVISRMCQVLEKYEMPYRPPELLTCLEQEERSETEHERTVRRNRMIRYCKNHTDNPSDPALYELYRAAEVFTSAFDCGKVLCGDEDQMLPWSKQMIVDLITETVDILQKEGYPAETPAELAG